MATELWAIALVLVATIVGSLGPIMMKKASSRVKFRKGKVFDKYLFAGFALYGISTIMFIPALKGGELSVLYPLVSVTYVWVSWLSMWMLKEKMNYRKWSGIALVIMGVILIGSTA
ncbi:MAG: EamA family transporter [Candidatus Woesearchaeota archaeon]